MGIFVLGAGLMGFIFGVGAAILSIIFLRRGRKENKSGPYLPYFLFGVIGCLIIFTLGYLMLPTGGSGAPSGNDYLRAIVGFAIIGFTPGGMLLGLFSLSLDTESKFEIGLDE